MALQMVIDRFWIRKFVCPARFRLYRVVKVLELFKSLHIVMFGEVLTRLHRFSVFQVAPFFLLFELLCVVLI